MAFYYFGRLASRQRVWRNVSGNHRACTDRRTITDIDPFQYRDARSHKNSVPNNYWPRFTRT
ncbi:hypothetical protein N9979_00225 [bacterium]|nr:hypothetical protein [bacterium]